MTIEPQGPFTAGDHGGCTYPIPGFLSKESVLLQLYVQRLQGPMVGVQALIWYRNLRAEVIHTLHLLQ